MLRKILIAVAVILLALGGVVAWYIAPAFQPAPRIEAGIAVGEKAPLDLALRDQSGEPTTLAAQMGEKGMVLMLVRSADWCTFCKLQLSETKAIEGDVAARGYTLASLSYDAPEILGRYKAQEGIGYAMLSDEGSAMIDALGLRDPQYYDKDNFAFGVPRASVLVLAPNGTVVNKFVSGDYRARPTNEEVLALIP